jgi:hypothetical protein
MKRTQDGPVPYPDQRAAIQLRADEVIQLIGLQF